MQKKFKILILATAVFVLAGCGNNVSENSSPITQEGNSPREINPTKTNEINEIEEESKKIAEAMKSGKEMKCSYEISIDGAEEGMVKTAVYLSGEKYMAETSFGNNVQKVIFDGEAMYSWSSGQNDGIKMTKECLGEMGEGTPSEENAENESFEAEIPEIFNGATSVKCEETSKINFTLPTDVKFTDQCQMMEDLSKNLPAGLPDMPNMPELE